jgi:pimeloyl-ACP methyl ester carboxylesterase
MRKASLLGLSASGFHRLAYCEWGAPDAPRTLICVHGLTRNGRDFDSLAATLAQQGYRVACPDVVGRGTSDWLADPAGYGYPQMLADAAALVARLGVGQLDWVGTSMGGLTGMMLAAQPKTPIARLVINDVGPFIPKAALARIAGYLGQNPVFPDLAEAEAYIRRVHAPFGALSDAQWRHLTEHSLRPAAGEGGGLRLRYDPAIAQAFAGEPEDVDLWSLWDAITIPVLLLRGAQSDLLPSETATEMTRRGPRAELVEIPGCGHAPALMDPAQIAIIADWLGR